MARSKNIVIFLKMRLYSRTIDQSFKKIEEIQVF